MASYNTVITNEGAALLASVIANQGTLTFSEMRFSTTDYDGMEQTLTVGTFGGVFITAAASGSVVDATTIKVESQFDNSGIVGDHPLYSIGIVGTDGNTTALIAVCTTTNPDIIRAALTGVSTYAFNVNLAVSSTSNITVTGTTAAVLYDTDIVNHLNSTDATKPLSANMGHTLGEEVNAVVNVYGAKNLLKNDAKSTTLNTVVVTVNDDKSVSFSGTASADSYLLLGQFTLDAGTYKLTGTPSGVSDEYLFAENITNPAYYHDHGSGVTFTLAVKSTIKAYIWIRASHAITSTYKPMIYDARIVDPTYEPFAETNQQLTVNKANRSDLASLNLTGTKNTTGVTITAGTYLYINGRYCRVIQDIGNNADFTENTNYVVTSLGGDLQGKYIYETSVQFNAYADGVKTNQTLINDVMTQLQSWKASNPNRAYQFNFLFLSLNSCTPFDSYIRTSYSDMSFKGMGLTPTDFFLRLIVAKTSASESYRGVGTFALTDESYEAATNDVSLIINVYQIL